MFDTLTGLFNKVGLQKKFGNIFGILYHPFRPFRAVSNKLEEAYEWRMMGEGLTYRVH